jgi:hypothetical protein
MNLASPDIRGHQLFVSQRGTILDLLLEDRGEWIPVHRLVAGALPYNARIKELRDAGYMIENRIGGRGKQGVGEFRIIACPGEPRFLFPETPQ